MQMLLRDQDIGAGYWRRLRLGCEQDCCGSLPSTVTFRSVLSKNSIYCFSFQLLPSDLSFSPTRPNSDAIWARYRRSYVTVGLVE